MRQHRGTLDVVTFDVTTWRLFAIALFIGFGEYAAVAALADVARHFGHTGDTASIASVIGLSGSVLGVGLAVLRLSSLGALPLTSLADRRGRRWVLTRVLVIGLGATALATLSPSYWWFVVCFAFGRPFLAAGLALVQVVTVELASATVRIRRLALVAAGSGAGAGVATVLHGVIRGGQNFRWLFALACFPLIVGPWLLRDLPEQVAVRHHTRLGVVPRAERGRLVIVAVIVGAVAVIAGPANGFVFVYGESILHIRPVHLALLVSISAVMGLLGLWLCHHVSRRAGRREIVAVGVVGTGLAATVAYSGGLHHFVLGYLLGVLMGGFLTPALNALGVELLSAPTRATAGGWIVVATVIGATGGLLVFGLIADGAQGPAVDALRAAGAWTFLPVLPLVALLARLPRETDYELDASRSRST